MNSSEEQFEELLANVVARVNKTLSKQADMVCMGLLLKGRDEIEVLLSLDDKEINLKEAIKCHLQGLHKDRELIPQEENAFELIQSFSEKELAFK